MEIQYALTEADYLAHQLYAAHKSKRIRKKRLRSRILMPIAYILFGVTIFSSSHVLAICFVVLGLSWYIFWPPYERGVYVRHYRGFIRENYASKLNDKARIIFQNDHIVMEDSGSKGTLSVQEISEINEIPDQLLIRFSGAQSLIIPKREIREIGELKGLLKSLASRLQIPYSEEPAWRWR